MSYVRFVVEERDPESTVRLGIFQAVAHALESKRLSQAEARHLRELERWFERNLPRPTRFTRTRNAPDHAWRGIAWFKDSAIEHIHRLREVVAILDHADVRVDIIWTDRPGYIVYEDDYQVVA